MNFPQKTIILQWFLYKHYPHQKWTIFVLSIKSLIKLCPTLNAQKKIKMMFSVHILSIFTEYVLFNVLISSDLKCNYIISPLLFFTPTPSTPPPSLHIPGHFFFNCSYCIYAQRHKWQIHCVDSTSCSLYAYDFSADQRLSDNELWGTSHLRTNTSFLSCH